MTMMVSISLAFLYDAKEVIISFYLVFILSISTNMV